MIQTQERAMMVKAESIPSYTLILSMMTMIIVKKHKSSKKDSNPMWIHSLLSPSSINRMLCYWEEQIIKFSQK